MPDHCRSCGHPLAEGEWTRCDAECRHHGDLRTVDRLGRPRAVHGNPIAGRVVTYSQAAAVEARGRARAEERDCPECDGEGYTFGLFADKNGILEHRRVSCEPCGSSGRVRPDLCQACEGAGDEP